MTTALATRLECPPSPHRRPRAGRRRVTMTSPPARPTEEVFLAALDAVNTVLGRASTRHRSAGCPERARRAPDGTVQLAYCDQGCFEGAVELLGDVVARLDSRLAATAEAAGERASEETGVTVLRAYALRTATAALGDRHRRRRRELGLPQRPERVAGADWATRVLPDPVDRDLLVHLLTWLGSDAPAPDGGGWPVDTWAARYGRSPAAMSVWIGRVVRAVHDGEPNRYERYLTGPLAAKPRLVTPVGVLIGAGVAV